MPTTATTYSYNDDNARLMIDLEDINERAPETLDSQPVVAPIFQMQHNTQDIEMRALYDEYPTEVHAFNYQIPLIRALRSERASFREAIRYIRRMQAYKAMYETIDNRYQQEVRQMLRNTLTSRDLRYIRDPEALISDQTCYIDMIRARDFYHTRLEVFKSQREAFGALQAEFTQRAAMIRQRPRTPVTIDTQEIVETLSGWDNVWGVAVHHNTYDQTLHIRVGVHGVVMNESSEHCVYDYEPEIMLAPFFFTIHLTAQGRFTVPSGGGNVMGLSRYQLGTLRHDMHPHQLSDSPCLGTFGQTFIDMASNGEMIPLISGMIGFYSQFNSQDSAGVDARLYHPGNISLWTNREEAYNTLYNGIAEYTEYYYIDGNCLNQAFDDYAQYHEADRQMAPPEYENTRTCYWCDETPVSDGYDYWTTYQGDRVCGDCWHDNYCEDCERPHEYCECSSEDEY